jgi:hypothetical protein
MRVHRRDAATLRRGLQSWQAEGLLDPSQAKVLDGAIEIAPFNWKGLARYSFLAALACLVTAVASVFADEAVMALIERVLSTSHVLRCLALAFIAAAVYAAGLRLRRRHPERVYSGEAVLFLGVVATAAALAELGAALDDGSGRVSGLFLLAAVLYAGLGYLWQSKLIWLFALLSLGSYMGTETGYLSGWGAYYLGMNFPMRFVLFGGVLIAAAAGMARTVRLEFLTRTTLVVGLLNLFIALWLMSIFGNYGDVDSWYNARQIEFFHWSLLFALAAIAAIYHGLRTDNPTTRGFGLTFLFINLYTRYFEFFWDAAPKAVFFVILAASFWALGHKAETIWNLGRDRHGDA